jgi:hypothetical protein
MTGSLFCVARGRDDAWEAFCFDLDLAVQGRSFDEVRGRLEQAVASYIESAEAEPEPTRSQLLNRRAPLLVRMTWGWRLLATALFRRRRDQDATVGFPVSCPA